MLDPGIGPDGFLGVAAHLEPVVGGEPDVAMADCTASTIPCEVIRRPRADTVMTGLWSRRGKTFGWSARRMSAIWWSATAPAVPNTGGALELGAIGADEAEHRGVRLRGAEGEALGFDPGLGEAFVRAMPYILRSRSMTTTAALAGS